MHRRDFLYSTLAGSLALHGADAFAADKPLPDLGINVSFKGRRFFPDDNPWNQDISNAPVDPSSAVLVQSIGLDRPLHPDFGSFWENQPMGFYYVVVGGNQPRVPVKFEYSDESEPGPYPVPLDAPIEGGPAASADSDRHILVVDRDNWRLYEMFHCFRKGNGFKAGSGAIFDLNSNKLRPAGWTSADAAGLPILPGLVRYDEVVEQKEIRHALRFTCRKTRRGYVPPATHWASRSKDKNLPPMGMRVRLKKDYDISRFPAEAQVILKALKKYGMILADNGSDWFVSGAHHSKWDNDALGTIKRVKGNAFEVVRMEGLVEG
jgi:hypothetical protein